MTLGPLSRPETAELAASVQAGALPATVQAQLFEATEGHPLFVVEAVRAGLDVGGGAGPLALSALPRVQAVIAARLEQLSPQALGAAQLAATIGRAFEIQVLRDASDLEEEGLVAALDELWQRAIIREQPGVGATISPMTVCERGPTTRSARPAAGCCTGAWSRRWSGATRRSWARWPRSWRRTMNRRGNPSRP
ncbi:hypothetical protein ACFP9V_04060 [Deinococcus radiopugnans]|uniref:hypothetical protein n=1 Tax=Deinococcus radiopugnans TaxID=57497 RepID=UPI0036213B55